MVEENWNVLDSFWRVNVIGLFYAENVHVYDIFSLNPKCREVVYLILPRLGGWSGIDELIVAESSS